MLHVANSSVKVNDPHKTRDNFSVFISVQTFIRSRTDIFSPMPKIYNVYN